MSFLSEDSKVTTTLCRQKDDEIATNKLKTDQEKETDTLAESTRTFATSADCRHGFIAGEQ